MRQQLENDALAYYFRRARAWRRPVATGWRWAWGVARYPCGLRTVRAVRVVRVCYSFCVPCVLLLSEFLLR